MSSLFRIGGSRTRLWSVCVKREFYLDFTLKIRFVHVGFVWEALGAWLVYIWVSFVVIFVRFWWIWWRHGVAWCEASWPVDWNGQEDGPILLAVVRLYLGEKPWGLVLCMFKWVLWRFWWVFDGFGDDMVGGIMAHGGRRVEWLWRQTHFGGVVRLSVGEKPRGLVGDGFESVLKRLWWFWDGRARGVEAGLMEIDKFVIEIGSKVFVRLGVFVRYERSIWGSVTCLFVFYVI